VRRAKTARPKISPTNFLFRRSPSSEVTARAAIALAATVLTSALQWWPIAALAQDEPRPVLQVRVLGEPIGWDDIGDFLTGVYKPNPQSPGRKILWKSPSDMPADARYVWYQGRDPGPPPVESIWISTDAISLPTSEPQYDEKTKLSNEQYVAATALAVMDAGNAGPTLQAIYARSPSDRASRLELGKSVARALQTASDQSAAFAAGEAAWIRSHIVAGVPRVTAYEMLKSKGLTAYNWAFIKGKPIPPPPRSSENSVIGGGCDTSDISSGAWPYQGEPLPGRQGVCAQIFASHPPESIRNPEARLELAGAFNLTCSWSIDVIIRFDDSDRVTYVQVEKPRSICI
jgi:hypothetical protein